MKSEILFAVTSLMFVGAMIAYSVGGPGASYVYGAAETTTINFSSDTSFAFRPDCDPFGELVFFSGTVHFAFNEVVRPDGSLKSSTMLNYMKFTGEGGSSGDKYGIHETDHESFIDNKNPSLIHSVIEGRLIHNGKEANTLVTINLATVYDGNGDPKTIVEHIDTKCVGS